MTATIDDLRIVIDPPNELVKEPPRAPAPSDDNTCAHCPEQAALRFDGHNPDTLKTPSDQPCVCRKPYHMCLNCYMGWFRWCSTKWMANDVATCGYCGAQGNTIEDLFPFQKV